MVNLRELEIRNQSLSLTVTAYDLVSSISSVITAAEKNRLLDDCFCVSSSLAEAFRTSISDLSESAFRSSLAMLLDLRNRVSMLSATENNSLALIGQFINYTDELLSELYVTLDAIEELKAEEFTPKLETTCF